ncbi:aldo/keto reductase [Nocardioides sp. Root1257]|uniref:aldo/keto reductase n=1 Tax=unclassified Nocardioides TaxID=2615069 RepID=UPI0006F814FD|nr:MULTISPECIES: aldo/keto reductase [unclassified Nocardioides]KQW44997.1 aldo/keto reductase [Nocardioides sp. Root1257]KRC45999.1 aldo/keto reductase [Nocardioides sp. Root224]
MTRHIGTIAVGDIGLGCMGLTFGYTATSGEPDDPERVLDHALDSGVRLLDTSDFYGPHTNEELVGRVLRRRREDVVISTKGGLVPDEDFMRPNGRPEHIRAACEGSLSRLGVDHIDLYQLHRTDPEVPLAETWGAMGDLVTEGKARHLGLCEVTVDQCDEAHRIHPVSSIQSELSIWERGALDQVLPWCRQHDAAFIAFSPLGRGFLTGAMSAATRFDSTDFRSRNPRFTPEALAQNQRIVDEIARIASAHEATPAQIALAWLLTDQDVLPIPGTTKTHRIDENLGAVTVTLSGADLTALAEIVPPEQPRY